MRHRRSTILLTAMLLITGCAIGTGFLDSFKTKPGQRPTTLPIKEAVAGFSPGYTISVQIMDGMWRPMCDLPDAANEISCYFYYGWLEKGMVFNPDGYLFMDGPTARQACGEALWSAGPTFSSYAYVDACARALMAYRWMIDSDYGVEGDTDG